MAVEKERKVVISEEDIQKKVRELGRLITEDYRDEDDIVVVSLLKGSFIFTADITRAMDLLTQIEFMTTSSYGDGYESSGKVKIVNDLEANIEGRNVLVVDDILDTGNTMSAIIEHLKKRNPKTLRSCVLLDKPDRREVEIEADYVGFRIPDLFIVGYGLNYKDYYRDVPYIFSFVD